MTQALSEICITAYQFTILPFGLSLAPLTFTNCMNAIHSPLRLNGERVLNYPDNWLLMAHSENVLDIHRLTLISVWGYFKKTNFNPRNVFHSWV